ncbi:MAG: MFS transporter [Patescibacteria group bacterium]
MFQKELKIMIVVSSTMTFIGAIFTPFYVTYIQSLNGSFLFAGSSLALFSILTGIFLFFLGKFETRYSEKKKLIASGYAVKGVSFVVIGLSLSNISLLVGLVLMSIGSALSMPAFDALYTKHVNKEDSSIQWADLQSVAYIITGMAALIGTVLIQNFGFREIFIALGVLALIVSIFVYRSKNL